MSDPNTEYANFRIRANMELKISEILHNPLARYIDPDVLVLRIMMAYDEVMSGKDN